MKKAELSIIIVSFNTKDLLKNCLNSIYSTVNNVIYEIIVVDNASEDGSQDIIENEFPDVILIKNSINTGFARANNQAIKIAKGRYLFLLNSDAIATEHSLEGLISFMDAHMKVAAAGPKVLNFNGTLQSKGHHFPSVLFGLIFLLRLPVFVSENNLSKWFPRFYWDENDTRPVEWISGSCMFLRKEVVDKIGGLSEDYFMYYEDVEWCYRAKKYDHEIWYYPNSQIFHCNMSSPNTMKLEVWKKSTKVFYRVHFGILDFILISVLDILTKLTRLFRIIIKSKEKNEFKNTKNEMIEQIKLLIYILK